MAVNFAALEISIEIHHNFNLITNGMAKLSAIHPEIKPDYCSSPGGPWRPAGFLWFSLALHFAALVSLILMPSFWTPALVGVGLNQLVLTLAGLWPKSRVLGPNWTRLPDPSVARGEVSITIDDGPDPEITPRVLDLLDRYGAKASFFCVAEKARCHPELCREIVARGHSVENHSLRHRLDFAFSGYRGFRREISEAQSVLTQLSGSAPLFFRAPFGIRNPILEPVLSRLGLQLASWTRRGFDTREHDPRRVYERLVKNLAAGDILLLHDGNAALTRDGEAVILSVLPPLLEAIQKAKLSSVSLRSAQA